MPIHKNIFVGMYYGNHSEMGNSHFKSVIIVIDSYCDMLFESW